MRPHANLQAQSAVMKKAGLITALMLSVFSAMSQQKETPEKRFTSKKGFSVYAGIQPMIDEQKALNESLTNAALPGISNFNLLFGLGTSYLFKTGTELALDVAVRNNQKATQAYKMNTTPLAYDFVVRQSLFGINDADFYVAAGAGGFEQYFNIERITPVPTSFNQALSAPNAVALAQFSEYMVFGLGLRMIDNNGLEKAFTQYAAIEIGYRHQFGNTLWNNYFHEINDGPEARLRQFYMSFKFGGMMKGKNKPVRRG